MRFLTRIAMLVAVVAVVAGPAAGDERGRLLAKVSELTDGALVVVHCRYADGAGGSVLSGVGVCYDAEKGDFLTLALGARIWPKKIESLTLVLPGPERRTIAAELLGARPQFGLAFVRAKEKHKWRAVRFAAKANLAVGQLVVTSGLMPASEANNTYVGSGYISAKLRVPEVLYYVTGGKLTCVGSPVFSADGVVIGLVSRTRYMDYQMPTARGSTIVSLQGLQETSFFVPVDEFAMALTDIPQGGQVPRPAWMGILKALGVGKAQAEVLGLHRPAVTIDNIIPDGPAATAGLKAGDVLTAIDGHGIEKLATPELTGRNFVRHIMLRSVGEKITVTVTDQGTDRKVALTLSKMPILIEEAPRYRSKALGLAVRQKVPLDMYLDKSATRQIAGLVVIAVAQRGPGQSAGLKAGDIITAVNGRKVRSVDLFEKMLAGSIASAPGKGIVFMIHRGTEQPRPITVTPASK